MDGVDCQQVTSANLANRVRTLCTYFFLRNLRNSMLSRLKILFVHVPVCVSSYGSTTDKYRTSSQFLQVKFRKLPLLSVFRFRICYRTVRI
jgi:hypothetical protein